MENLNVAMAKKALECCTSYCDKDNCPYKTHDIPIACMTMKMTAALALINSQEQKIKELAVEFEAMRGAANSYKMHNEKLTEENERLKTDLEIRNMKRASIFEIADAFDRGRIKGKADTVRKMHSMLCEGRVSNDNVVIVANQVAKEMLEGE